MAEDGDDFLEEESPAYEEEQNTTSRQPNQQYVKELKRCNIRIDELSTPNKRMFLALWNEHAHHLPSEKLDTLKQLLQQFYAMTPE